MRVMIGLRCSWVDHVLISPSRLVYKKSRKSLLSVWIYLIIAHSVSSWTVLMHALKLCHQLSPSQSLSNHVVWHRATHWSINFWLTIFVAVFYLENLYCGTRSGMRPVAHPQVCFLNWRSMLKQDTSMLLGDLKEQNLYWDVGIKMVGALVGVS